MTLNTFTSSKTATMKHFYKFAINNSIKKDSLWEWVEAFETWKKTKALTQAKKQLVAQLKK